MGEIASAELPELRLRNQELLSFYLAIFEFVHNARRRGKALLSALVAALVR
ncbi:MAG: hypothetical protein INR62_08605 [Rhodospirillales bacterium]|nr:hypothetical protein [Acetobacter sp.]